MASQIVPIDIPIEKIAQFVGKNGFFIKTKLVIKTKKMCLESVQDTSLSPADLWKQFHIHCNVRKNEDSVVVELKTPDQMSLDCLLRNLNEYVIEFNEKKSKRPENLRIYSFHLHINPRFTGKLIGVEGSHIQTLANRIQIELSLEKPPFLRFIDKHHPKSTPIHFNDIDDKGDTYLLVKFVGEKSLLKIKQILETFVKETIVDPTKEELKEVW